MSIVAKVEKYLKQIEKENKEINAILHVNPSIIEEAKNLGKKEKKGKLAGTIIAVKSNINVKGLTANCASNVLDNYTAPYNATVIEKLKAEDALIIGMTNMDEFAAGGSGEHSAFGPAINPAAPDRITGGSSSGSAAAVAAGFCDVSLGSDTGGSIRNPASNCGIVGVKPSYGLVSRHGLIDLSMSLDQIGPFANSVEEAAIILDVIKGKDENDTTTQDSKSISIKPIKKVKIGMLRIKGVDSKIQQLIEKTIEKAAIKPGWKLEECEIKYIDLAVQTYYLLVYAEFFSATRRFDGRKYGHKIEDHCGPEVLRRILGGSEITKAEHAGRYYQKALHVKDLIKNEFLRVFQNFDAIILPTVPKLPWKAGTTIAMPPEDEYAFDALTIPANLAGCCALSLPAGKIDSIPIGMQVMCAPFEESKMFSLAKMIESSIQK